jgi:hypothetical protein
VLTRERIIDTAIALADRDGFEAVTLRRIDEAKLPVSPVGWEEWVRGFFAAIAGLAENHPGAFTALQRRTGRTAR